jgi:hypothetical protein
VAVLMMMMIIVVMIMMVLMMTMMIVMMVMSSLQNLRLYIEQTYGLEASNRLFQGIDQVLEANWRLTWRYGLL